MSREMERYLTALEALDVAAMAERIFPADEEGLGATDLHVVDYIDAQLAGPWGRGARMYLQAPFDKPRDGGHGWQSELTPCETYRHCLAVLARHTSQTYGRRLAALTAEEQDQVLTALSSDSLEGFDEVPGSEFFNLLRQNVIEGLFADPLYRGNYRRLGWQWIGYPGVATGHADDYRERVDRYGEPYTIEPVALP
jgi:gluconate 2-dehydrogenase gamma chain